jgi:hypothetical protein
MLPVSRVTTGHEEIQSWVEEHGGFPVAVPDVEAVYQPGVLGIRFPGDDSDDGRKEIPWEEFFKRFDARRLAFIYKDQPANGRVEFAMLVHRDCAQARHAESRFQPSIRIMKSSSR